MLTNSDLLKIESLIERKLEEKLEQKLKFIPTTEQFFSKMDEVMGELHSIRQEVTFLAHHSSQHTDDIDRLKLIHPNFSHI